MLWFVHLLNLSKLRFKVVFDMFFEDNLSKDVFFWIILVIPKKQHEDMRRLFVHETRVFWRWNSLLYVFLVNTGEMSARLQFTQRGCPCRFKSILSHVRRRFLCRAGFNTWCVQVSKIHSWKIGYIYNIDLHYKACGDIWVTAIGNSLHCRKCTAETTDSSKQIDQL